MADTPRETIAPATADLKLSAADPQPTLDPASTPPAHQTPGRIGNYEIINVLGQGGMGTVYRALHSGTRRKVALKLMSAINLRSERARLRFQREVDLAARLEHPHIARVYDGGENADGTWFYTMELIDGVDLDRFVVEQKLLRPQVLKLMQSVAQAVHYAHVRGIIHRDLKPSNVLVSPDGSPHILDFGLAKSVLEEPQAANMTLTLDGEVGGTPAYMSPEQAAGDTEQISTRSDVYTLGVILYKLLTGHFPTDVSGSYFSILRRIIAGEVRNPAQLPADPTTATPTAKLPADLQAIVFKALATEPDRRYASAQELADDLRRYVEGEPVLAKGPSLAYVLRKRLTKHRGRLAAVGVIVVVAICGGLLLRATLRSRQITALNLRIDSQLTAGPTDDASLSSLEALADRLNTFSPDLAQDARERIYHKYADSIDAAMQRSLSGEVAGLLQNRIATLAPHLPEAAAALRQKLIQRRQDWHTFLDLSPPFTNLGQFDGADTIRLQRGRLVCKAGRARLTSIQQYGLRNGLEVQIDFNVAAIAPSSAASGRSGTDQTLLEAAIGSPQEERGYRFCLNARGISVMRNYVVLSRRALPEPGLMAGVHALRARLSGGTKLHLQCDAQPPLEFDDAFPLPASQAGSVALTWNPIIQIDRLGASAQSIAAAPSPLEDGDNLYAQGRLDEALARYQAQAIAGAGDVHQEARFKMATCRLELHDEQEAQRIFESLSSEEGDRWPPLAGVRLWLLNLQQQKYDTADRLADNLLTRFRFAQLIAQTPDEVRQSILELCRKRLIAGRGLGAQEKFDPRIAEQLIEAHRAMGDDANAADCELVTCIQAFEDAGETGKLDQIMNDFLAAPDEHPESLWRVVMQYCSALRAQNRLSDARAVVQRLVDPPDARMSRSRRMLLLESAREDMAAADQPAAEHHLSLYFQLVSAREAAAETWTAAAILEGFFIKDRLGCEAAVRQWRMRMREFDEQLSQRADSFPWNQGGFLSAQEAALRSLAGELTDEQAARITSQLMSKVTDGSDQILTSVGIGLVKVPNKAVADIWRTPEGENLARDVALRLQPDRQLIQRFASACVGAAMRLDTVADAATAEQAAALQRIGVDLLQQVRDHRIGKLTAAQLVSAWYGADGFLGWAGAKARLSPAFRPEAAYLFGLRFRRLGNESAALGCLRIASAEGDRVINHLAEQAIHSSPPPQSQPAAE